MKKQLKKGFTLTELVIVIVIIAILAAVLIPSMTGYVERAKKSSNEQTAESIATVFAAWLIDESDKNSYTSNGTAALWNAQIGADKEAGDKVYCDYTEEVKYTSSDELPEGKSVGDVKTAAKYTVTIGSNTLELVAADVKDNTLPTSDGDVELSATGATHYNEKVANYAEDDAAAALYSFKAYYLVASGENTTTTAGIIAATSTSFVYQGSSYTTTATYAQGAFTYETVKNSQYSA